MEKVESGRGCGCGCGLNSLLAKFCCDSCGTSYKDPHNGIISEKCERLSRSECFLFYLVAAVQQHWHTLPSIKRDNPPPSVCNSWFPLTSFEIDGEMDFN